MLDRFIVATRDEIIVAQVHMDDERQWIEFHGALPFCDGAIKLTRRQQHRIAKPLMRGRVIRIQRNRAFEFLDRTDKIQIIITQD